MADIRTGNGDTVVRLRQWLGLNESPDGDTGLKPGEASVMRNFRITREGHLQTRPGTAQVAALAQDKPVLDIWSGELDKKNCLFAVCNDTLWSIDAENGRATGCPFDTTSRTGYEGKFFQFEGNLYLLTGMGYYRCTADGAWQEVEGYIPTVVTAAPPEGGGTLLERVNLLTGKKKAKYSPDGTATVFQLPESGITEVLAVEGTDIGWTADLSKGTVTFASPPAEGTNTLTFLWNKVSNQRAAVDNMRGWEIYNGDTDARVFLYGDGTNRCIYSGLDGDGQPTAEYFPDMNVLAVGEANVPVTSLIRHYDRLLVFKEDSAWTVGYSTLTLEDGAVTAAFCCTPLNRQIGCAGYGQAVLVGNDPRTLHGQAVYEWTLSGSGTRDERNARRISDRVEVTLSGFDTRACVTFDDEYEQEYYIFCGDRTLVHNYGRDAWYLYEGLSVTCARRVKGELYFGTADGRVLHVSRRYRGDSGAPIDACWESGAMDFDRDWRVKYTAELWLSLKPESQGRLEVTLKSNRKTQYPRKTAAAGLVTFARADFGHWSFSTNRQAQVQRVRLKARKVTFWKLVLESCSATAAATVLAADVRVRYAGNVR